jgi:hypothetical protein
MDPQIQELLDKKACEEVLMRYSRTLDWLDDAGQAACYWPDADIDYGFYTGTADGFVPVVMEIEKSALRRWHLVGGLLIEIDGNLARSECYGFTVSAAVNEAGETADNLFGGRYLDELEKRDGEWRISKRRYILDFTYQLPHGLEELAEAGLNLPILQIREPGHSDYREL